MTLNSEAPRYSEWSEWASKASPLFKWAGGKQKFLWHHTEYLPKFTGTYHEPFGGGLSVFFHYASRSPEKPLISRLADTNVRLIKTYQAIKTDWRKVANQLAQIEAAFSVSNDKEAFYYETREAHNLIHPKEDAARFIFLMQAGWNGVFRSNSKGKFNVPVGSLNRNISLPDANDLRAVSAALQFATLRASSWETSVTAVKAGDFVFLDPPYYKHSNSTTTLYDQNQPFEMNEQEKLAKALSDIERVGANFLLTNSAYPEIVELYLDYGFRVDTVLTARSINSKTSDRGFEDEIIVRPSFKELDSDVSVTLDLMLKMNKARKTKGERTIK